MKSESLKEIAGRYEVPDGEFALIAGGQISYTYEFQCESRPLIIRAVKNEGKRYELTIAETDFVQYLADNGVNASRPVPSRNGALTEKLEIAEGEFVVTLFERAPGKEVSIEEWTPGIWTALGEELGAIHRLTREYEPPHNVRRPHWHEAEIMDIEKYIPEGQKALREKAAQLIAELKGLPADQECYGLIHSDPGRGNIYSLDGKITLFDFEDCEYHWLINDIAVALYFAVDDSFNGDDIRSYVSNYLRAFFQGYNRQSRLDDSWLEKIPLFHKLRDLLTVLYFYAEGGNGLGEEEIIKASHSRINLEFDRNYLPIDLIDV